MGLEADDNGGIHPDYDIDVDDTYHRYSRQILNPTGPSSGPRPVPPNYRLARGISDTFRTF